MRSDPSYIVVSHPTSVASPADLTIVSPQHFTTPHSPLADGKHAVPTHQGYTRPVVAPERNTMITGAKDSLQILRVLAASQPIPFLRTIATLALALVEIAESARRMREGCQDIKELVLAITITLLRTTEGQKQLDPRLRSALESFQIDLEDIKDGIQRVQHKSFFTLAIYREEYREIIRNYKQKLLFSIAIFHIDNGINMQIKLSEQHEKVMARLSHLHNELKHHDTQPPQEEYLESGPEMSHASSKNPTLHEVVRTWASNVMDDIDIGSHFNSKRSKLIRRSTRAGSDREDTLDKHSKKCQRGQPHANIVHLEPEIKRVGTAASVLRKKRSVKNPIHTRERHEESVCKPLPKTSADPTLLLNNKHTILTKGLVHSTQRDEDQNAINLRDLSTSPQAATSIKRGPFLVPHTRIPRRSTDPLPLKPTRVLNHTSYKYRLTPFPKRETMERPDGRPPTKPRAKCRPRVYVCMEPSKARPRRTEQLLVELDQNCAQSNSIEENVAGPNGIATSCLRSLDETLVDDEEPEGGRMRSSPKLRPPSAPNLPEEPVTCIFAPASRANDDHWLKLPSQKKLHIPTAVRPLCMSRIPPELTNKTQLMFSKEPGLKLGMPLVQERRTLQRRHGV